MSTDPLYAKWTVSDDYRRLVEQATVHRNCNNRFIGTPERMREVMVEFMPGHTISEVAEEAHVDESVVRRLLENGIAPYLEAKKVMRALNINATVMPAECVAA